MKKFLLVIAALACCSALAQAGIVKEYFTELCARTEIEPIVMPVSQIQGNAAKDAVEMLKVANMTDETFAEAMALAEGWDKSKLAMDITEDDTSVKVFAEEVEGDKAECLIMVKEENSPLVFVYIEGKAEILKTLN